MIKNNINKKEKLKMKKYFIWPMNDCGGVKYFIASDVFQAKNKYRAFEKFGHLSPLRHIILSDEEADYNCNETDNLVPAKNPDECHLKDCYEPSAPGRIFCERDLEMMKNDFGDEKKIIELEIQLKDKVSLENELQELHSDDIVLHLRTKNLVKTLKNTITGLLTEFE